MDVPFPADLEWVSYLAGSRWPPGSESAWWRTAGYVRAAAGELEALVPELERVRLQTQAVLKGQTGHAADRQFAELFSGDASVDRVVEALRSLGDAAEGLGREVQYTKLQIVSMLVIAAGSIIWALANSEWTFGASLAEIPLIRWLLDNAMTRLVAMVLARIEAELAARLGSTLVARLIVEGIVSAGIGAAQEGAIETVQVAEGQRDGVDVLAVLHSAVSMAAAAGAGGLVGHGLGALLGTDGNLGLRMLKGAVMGLSSAEAANVAATVVGGGNVGAGTFLGGAIGLVHGGIGGAGGHGVGDVEPVEGSAVPTTAGDDARVPSGGDGAAGDGAAGVSRGEPSESAAPSSGPVGEPGPAVGDRVGETSSPASSAGAGEPGARSVEGPAGSSDGSTSPGSAAPGEGGGAGPGLAHETPVGADPAGPLTDGGAAGAGAPATTGSGQAAAPGQGALAVAAGPSGAAGVSPGAVGPPNSAAPAGPPMPAAPALSGSMGPASPGPALGVESPSPVESPAGLSPPPAAEPSAAAAATGSAGAGEASAPADPGSSPGGGGHAAGGHSPVPSRWIPLGRCRVAAASRVCRLLLGPRHRPRCPAVIRAHRPVPNAHRGTITATAPDPIAPGATAQPGLDRAS